MTCIKNRCKGEAVQRVAMDGSGEMAGYCEKHWRKVANLPPLPKTKTGDCARCSQADGTKMYPLGEERVMLCKPCYRECLR